MEHDHEPSRPSGMLNLVDYRAVRWRGICVKRGTASKADHILIAKGVRHSLGKASYVVQLVPTTCVLVCIGFSLKGYLN